MSIHKRGQILRQLFGHHPLHKYHHRHLGSSEAYGTARYIEKEGTQRAAGGCVWKGSERVHRLRHRVFGIYILSIIEQTYVASFQMRYTGPQA